MTVRSRPLQTATKDTKTPEGQAPGEGIRSLKTSSLFRAVNFELYAKPNKYMIIFGIGAASFTFGYLVYMRESWRKQKVYTALNHDDQLVVTKKVSRWD